MALVVSVKVVFNTIRLCAANRDSSDLVMRNFYLYEQFR